MEHKETKSTEIRFDGLIPANDIRDGYYGKLWALNASGERVEVEVHLNNLPYHIEAGYPSEERTIKTCLDILRRAFIELNRKLNPGS